MNAIALTISNVLVRQDDQGRYCLNDLHKAAGGEKRHQPSDWLRIQQTQELVYELENHEPGIPGTKKAVETIQGKGKAQGTYAVKELVYAYAMWISSKFHIAVIRAYDALQQHRAVDNIQAEPQPLPSLIDGRLLLTIRNGQIISSEPLSNRAQLFTPDSAPSIRAWVLDYIPAKHLHIALQAINERSMAISNGMQQQLPQTK